ncbi:uncharacterized protein EI90DRAFT_3123445 [Cantharellus anzutake]|uniref:uncharacterized protein n=1 Tax=Cantharellus anzutake TaxID=1750568 RepID=UPI001902D16B|nr:uncharacterized protein EI90DRAFT_3123445 [Cantharellus anzutake]KAF8331276.1 hypothetical protein EI90DRAFT_3123445 [Cantharellus anzutake]
MVSPEDHEPYGEKPEWSDISPVPQDEGSFVPMAPIIYGDEYKDATNYFRAILKKGEQSKRVLDLTEHIIRMNPSHYTVWQYRYDTLLAVKSDLDAELDMMNDIASKHLKTYQVWHHRRLLLTHLRKPRPELVFIANALQEDAKNYHTWAYRQWILAEFNDDDLWAGELAFVEKMLSEDLRNNSAWHHRFFVVFDSGVRTGDEDREVVLKRELSFTKEKLSMAPNNASAWNFLRGVLERTGTPFSTLEGFVIPYSRPLDRSTLPTASSEAPVVDVDLENPLPSPQSQLPCPQAIEFVADILEEKAAAGDEKELVRSFVDQANELYKSLATEYDTMRQRYWEFRQKEASKLIVS